MDTEIEYKNIVFWKELLKKHIYGKLNKQERGLLAGWLWEDRRNREMYRRLCLECAMQERYEKWKGVNPRHEYGLLLKRFPEIKNRERNYLRRFGYAAAVVLFCSIGLSMYLLFDREERLNQFTQVAVAEKLIDAILTTADGRVVTIQREKVENQESVKGLEVRFAERELLCVEDSTASSANIHLLEIPRGGEYHLILPDGTVVYLNSGSSIRFPEKFAGKTREIEVSGEVYLKVKANATSPFIVRTGDYRTEVLGTRFLTRAYPGEKEWVTVLEEGKVKVIYGKQQVILKPGQKSCMETGNLSVGQANMDKELAWVHGVFVFENDDLEKITNCLSRWYDVSFRFEREELKKLPFTGKEKRDMGVREILNLIESTNVVVFEDKGDYFLVR